MRLFFARLWPDIAENLGPCIPPALLDNLIGIKVGERSLLILGLVIGFFGFRELWGNGQRRILIALVEELEGLRTVS